MDFAQDCFVASVGSSIRMEAMEAIRLFVLLRMIPLLNSHWFASNK
jgi:hypothetical protein